MSTDYEEAREAALRILGRRRRTRSQVEEKLRAKGFERGVIQAVCDRLEELRLLDDLEYARLFLESRRSKPRGRRLLQQQLRAKGVAHTVALQALEEMKAPEEGGGELERAVALARRSLGKVAGLPPREARNKLFQMLARRGFEMDTAQAAVRQALED